MPPLLSEELLPAAAGTAAPAAPVSGMVFQWGVTDDILRERGERNRISGRQIIGRCWSVCQREREGLNERESEVKVDVVVAYPSLQQDASD